MYSVLDNLFFLLLYSLIGMCVPADLHQITGKWRYANGQNCPSTKVCNISPTGCFLFSLDVKEVEKRLREEAEAEKNELQAKYESKLARNEMLVTGVAMLLIFF